MPPEKHFGYAFQWASLAIAWLILMICLRIKTKRKSEDKSTDTSSILSTPQ
jgi:surfeit locus 1 family protein